MCKRLGRVAGRSGGILGTKITWPLFPSSEASGALVKSKNQITEARPPIERGPQLGSSFSLRGLSAVIFGALELWRPFCLWPSFCLPSEYRPSVLIDLGEGQLIPTRMQCLTSCPPPPLPHPISYLALRIVFLEGVTLFSGELQRLRGALYHLN